MLVLYDSKATSFDTLGLGVLKDIKSDPIITEELNGTYTLEFDYVVEGYLSDKLVEGNIIKANSQPFRIWNITKNIDAIKILAKHIFFDLSKNFIDDVAPTNLSSQGAIEWILKRTQYSNNFSVNGSCTELASARYVEKNVIDAIFNEDNAILKRFGGELELDSYNIYVHSKRGNNAKFSIRYGKNLSGIDFNLDFSTVVTRMCPQGRDGLQLDTKYIDSPLINNYFMPFYKKIEFDIGVDDNTTEEQAKQKLLEAAKQEFNEGLDIPNISVKVDFIELSKCIEYSKYSNLESCHLGDTVQAVIPNLNLNITTRIVKTVYNCVLKRITSLELGNTVPNFVTESNKKDKATDSAIKKINTTDILKQAREDATNIINHPFNGNLYIDENTGSLYLLDTTDPATAQYVWKWNLGGLGFSSTGINGNFETAITQDGKIVADFITTGTMAVERIKGLSKQLELIVESVDTIKTEAIKKVEVQYALNDSETEAPTTGWSTEAPEWVQGAYMWQKTVTTYADETIVETACTCISGAKGDTGATGADGKDGINGTNGINGKSAYEIWLEAGNTGSEEEFLLSLKGEQGLQGLQGPQGEQGIAGPTGPQGEQGPQGEKGETGDKGDTGEQGPKGDTGATGSAGATSYFHIKYSANENGNPMTETPSTYIGTYVDFTEADSTDYTKYTWSRFQGIQGEQGIAGTNGSNGQTSYLHIKYSNDGGSTFTSNNGETVGDYIGQYVDFIETDSTSVSSYKWSLIKGETGEQGPQGEQGEKGETGDVGPQGEQGIAGADGQRGTGIYKVTTAPSSYTTATGGFTPTYRIALSTVLSQSGATEIIIGDNLRYSYYLYPVGYVDSSYVYCGSRSSIRGATGATGAAGADGTDGKGISNIIEYYLASSIGAGSGATIEWNADTTGLETFTYMDFLSFYKVSDQVPTKEELVGNTFTMYGEGENVAFEIKESSTDDEYIVSDITDDGNVYMVSAYLPTIIVIKEPTTDFPYSAGTYFMLLPDGSGYTSSLTVPAPSVTVDTEGWTTEIQTTDEINKYLWNYEVIEYTDGTNYTSNPVIIGTHGEDGIDGIGVKDVIAQYYLSTSNTETVDGEWTESQPEIVSGTYMWTRSQVSWTDDTVSYTTPILAEALNTANNNALISIEKHAEQEITNNSIIASVAEIETTMTENYMTKEEASTQYSQLKDSFEFNINSALTELKEDGISKVVTTQVTINNEGIEVGKSDSEFTNKMNNTGTYQYFAGELRAKYDKDGADIPKLKSDIAIIAGMKHTKEEIDGIVHHRQYVLE